MSMRLLNGHIIDKLNMILSKNYLKDLEKLAMKKYISRKVLYYVFSIILVSLAFAGCAHTEKAFNPDITGPQMICEPDVVRLGVAKVMDTEFVFKGKGFQPEDSVFITMLGVKKGDKKVDIPVFEGEVDKKGCFEIKTQPGYDPAGLTFKIGILLRAKTGSNEKGETILIVSEPPIPDEVYTMRAVSMESDKKAECTLLIKGPSFVDKMKDWIGGLMGKIVKE